VFCYSSASNSSGTPPPEKSGAPDISGALGALMGRGPQVSVAGAASNKGTPITKIVPEVDMTTAAGVTASSSVGEACDVPPLSKDDQS
jgi:hypothetical protein